MLKNICLIGLATLKNVGFIEIDKMIENKYKKKLKEIINNGGVNNFLKIENEIAKTLYCNNNIISTGGSMIYNKDAMLFFKNNLNCEIIHLELNYKDFLNRVGDFNERGIINPYGLTLNELYLERIRLCNVYSDITINCDDLDLGFKRLVNNKLYD